VFAALLGSQLVAATPGFRRHPAALGFSRVIQLFLFHRRRHLLVALIIWRKRAVCQSSHCLGEDDSQAPLIESMPLGFNAKLKCFE